MRLVQGPIASVPVQGPLMILPRTCDRVAGPRSRSGNRVQAASRSESVFRTCSRQRNAQAVQGANHLLGRAILVVVALLGREVVDLLLQRADPQAQPRVGLPARGEHHGGGRQACRGQAQPDEEYGHQSLRGSWGSTAGGGGGDAGGAGCGADPPGGW